MPLARKMENRQSGDACTTLDISTKSYDGGMGVLANYTIAFDNPFESLGDSTDDENTGAAELGSSVNSFEEEQFAGVSLKSPNVDLGNGMRKPFDAEDPTALPKLKSVTGKKPPTKLKDTSLE